MGVLKLNTGLSFLDKGLSCNPDLKQAIYNNSKERYLKLLEQLFEELYKGKVEGIETKVLEISDLSRFEALVSELEFARYFLQNNVFGKRRAPDMLVTSNLKEYFVEVKNIQLDDEEYILGSKIADVLNSLGLSFMVVLKSSSVLATPAYKHQTIRQKEKICETFINEFKEKLKNISLNSPKISIGTAVADVELHATEKRKSYFGIGTMKQAITEPPEYKERIKFDVLQKAKKREDWTGDELDKFYIVAIDDDSLFFYVDRYNVELFGNATYCCSPLPVPRITIDSKIANALEHGWKGYWQEMCVIPNSRSVIPDNERGMFFNEPEMKSVTAVLIRHRGSFYLLANPFSDERINNPQIFSELSGFLTGWKP
jgi:hypothetical protein